MDAVGEKVSRADSVTLLMYLDMKQFLMETQKTAKTNNRPATIPYVKQSTTTFGASELDAKPTNQTIDPTTATMRQP